MRLYLADIRTLPDPAAMPSVMEGLPEARQDKCLWYLQPDDRKRSLAAGLVIARILQDAGCSSPLTLGQNGKPEAEGCHFNISHGGHYVLGVHSNSAVGCDVEEMTAPPLETADHYFHGQEKAWLENHQDKAFAFWQLWTLKESYMKMTGEGMQLPLDAFSVTVGQDITLRRNGVLQACALTHLVYNNHSIGICADRHSGPPGLISWRIYDGKRWQTLQ